MLQLVEHVDVDIVSLPILRQRIAHAIVVVILRSVVSESVFPASVTCVTAFFFIGLSHVALDEPGRFHPALAPKPPPCR